MGIHDEYGKGLFHHMLGQRWNPYDCRRNVDEDGVRADLDGIIQRSDGTVECAVEIEARVYKQIRGSIVDLALHPASKKLLVIIRAQPQLGEPNKIRRHCDFVWKQITENKRGQFVLAILEGTGQHRLPDQDIEILRESLMVLGLAL